jgi:hypothetical protein
MESIKTINLLKRLGGVKPGGPWTCGAGTGLDRWHCRAEGLLSNLSYLGNAEQQSHLWWASFWGCFQSDLTIFVRRSIAGGAATAHPAI